MNLNKINESKKQIIKNLNPSEMESYIKSLIANLYEAFIEHDSDKAIASKELIEEATSIYYNNGYSNSMAKELEFRLAKANECLIQTLEDKAKVEGFLSEEIIKNLLNNQMELLTYSNSILNILIASYEKEPSEHLLDTVKAVHGVIKLELIFLESLLQDNFLEDLSEKYPEKVAIIEDGYSDYEKLAMKINSF